MEGIHPYQEISEKEEVTNGRDVSGQTAEGTDTRPQLGDTRTVIKSLFVQTIQCQIMIQTAVSEPPHPRAKVDNGNTHTAGSALSD